MRRPPVVASARSFRHTIPLADVVAAVIAEPGRSDWYYVAKLAPLPNWLDPAAEAVKKALRQGLIVKRRKGNSWPIFPTTQVLPKEG